jgi:hypothetical protein
MGVLLSFTLVHGFTGKFFPLCGGSEGFEVLEGAAVQGDMRGSEDSPEVQESLFLHFIAAEKVPVIVKVPQEPIELPESSLGAVQPANDGPSGKGLGLEHHKPDGKEWFLVMPAVGSSVDTDQEQPFKETVAILSHGMQAWDMAFHGFPSAG